LFGLLSSGPGLFNEAVLAERGFSQQIYVRFLAGTTVVGLAGQMLTGWLTVRWSMQRLLGIAMFFYAAALTALPFITGEAQLWIFAVLIACRAGRSRSSSSPCAHRARLGGRSADFRESREPEALFPSGNTYRVSTWNCAVPGASWPRLRSQFWKHG